MWKLVVKFIKVYLWPLVKRTVWGFIKKYITGLFKSAALLLLLLGVVAAVGYVLSTCR